METRRVSEGNYRKTRTPSLTRKIAWIYVNRLAAVFLEQVSRRDIGMAGSHSVSGRSYIPVHRGLHYSGVRCSGNYRVGVVICQRDPGEPDFRDSANS